MRVVIVVIVTGEGGLRTIGDIMCIQSKLVSMTVMRYDVYTSLCMGVYEIFCLHQSMRFSVLYT